MLPAWYLRGTYFSDKWHNCHEKFAPKKAKKNIQNKSGCRENAAKNNICREKAAMPRTHLRQYKSGSSENICGNAAQKTHKKAAMPHSSGTLA